VLRILIVGGTGFIGRRIAEMAVGKGYSVTLLSLGNKRISAKLEENVDTIQCDATSSDNIRLSLGGCGFEYVVNCSGYIDHSPIKDGGDALIDQHFKTVRNLVECLDRKALKSFIQIGSSDEYGGNRAPQSEKLREAPISPYSFGKAASTHFLQMLHRTEGFPATILRLFLVYGPGQDMKRFIPQVIGGCLRDEEFPASAGTQMRDFCYIDDVVDAVFMAMENDRARGEVINVASGTGVSIRSVVERIQELSGGGRPQFGKVPYRSGDHMALYADISKAKELLGWKPRTQLEDGLRRTIEYYQSSEGLIT